MAPAAALWESPRNKSVCVMDASGLLGTALVNRLLQRGYTVHAALNRRDELQRYKLKLSENSKLRVFNSDPLDYHSITEAVRGCCALFYSFELPPEHPTYDELTSEVEVRAAHNVLEACAQTDSIEKIIFASSATAIIWRDVDHQHHHGLSSDFDERSWSDINFCRKFKLWHGLSKTVAEKTAWALAMDRGVNMVSINSGLLMHPKLSTQDPYLSGAAEMFKGGIFVTVDLKFLVNAHLCAFEDASSYGRYLCFNHVINCGKDILQLAKMLLPSASPHGEYGLEDDKVYQKRITSDKLSKLMVDFDGTVQLQLGDSSM